MSPDRPGCEDHSDGDRNDDRSDADRGDGRSDADRTDRLRALHDHLAATAELPVEPSAARWLGEAEAVVSDVADGDAPAAAIETRMAQARELLSHVEETGSPEADEHVEAARELVAALEERL